MRTPVAVFALFALVLALGSGACSEPATRLTPATLRAVEDARPIDVSLLRDALTTDDPDLQRLAVRALGRLERPEHASAVLVLAGAADPAVRRAAADALGQMRAPVDLSNWLDRETDAGVRQAIYETIGRSAPIVGVSEARLVAGLGDESREARSGAVHGLEAYIRLNARTLTPAAETVLALRRFVRDQADAELRELGLLALAGARDRDEATLRLALTDTSPGVRRLAVMGLRQWVDDPAPMVRYEALRLAPTCDRVPGALTDDSGHVRLLAIDLVGTLPCDAALLTPLLTSTRWHDRAHALVSLARIAPERARQHLPALAADPVWQARAYAARAARLLNEHGIRATLAADPAPNVAIAALAEPAEAIAALGTSHRGLLMAAAELLEGTPELTAAAPRLLDAFLRLSREDRPTSRDARIALLGRLGEARLPDGSAAALAQALRPWLSDRDPVVAARVAEVITTQTGEAATAVTEVYRDDALPAAKYIDGLERATAVVTMRGLGTFSLELLPEEAPVTVAVFARHAEQGGYDGTTWHRVVPNFVLQGGSPGAHEVDGAVGPYMRDELGLTRHLRGTLGISTRGRDTGDAQIFINLVDNFRLDHQYTVFARITSGMDVVDRILEGDVIERVEIRRRN